MKFIDRTKIRVKSGRGGDGIVSFASSKGRPKLGPDGGDGGKGGDVILYGNGQLNTLSTLRYKQLYKAEDGQKGGTNAKKGRSGAVKMIEVPVGTIALNEETGEFLGEILENGDKITIAKGGRGGLGNIHWVKANHQAPHQFRPGGEPEEFSMKLELKLIADVGFAGFPNAGKSSLLSVITSAKPKVGDYPFTTLVPNLGVVDINSDIGESFVAADIPGLINGASEGKGLGLEFLRHIERTKVLAVIIDINSYEVEPTQAYEELLTELSSYDKTLLDRPRVIVLNKCDICSDEEVEIVSEEFAKYGHKVVLTSAATHRGLDELKRELYELLPKTDGAE